MLAPQPRGGHAATGISRVLGGAAASWPVVARAQQPPKPVIGFLSSASAASSEHLLAPLRQGLDQEGYAEGRNLMIEYRWAETQFDRLPGLAADLVRQNVVLIVTGGGSPPALAVKSVAPAMPVVFILGADPVKVGLTASFNRPGGNITGVTMLANDLAAKRLGSSRSEADCCVVRIVTQSEQRLRRRGSTRSRGRIAGYGSAPSYCPSSQRTRDRNCF